MLLIRELRFSYSEIMALSFSKLEAYVKRALEIVEAKEAAAQEQ